MPARRTIHRVRIRRLRVTGLFAVFAVIAGVLGYQSLASSSSTVLSPPDVGRSEPRAPRRVANLDPDLRAALRQAAADAADHGIALIVDSGWRSPEHQEQLLREAVSKYGSDEEAARWVATPEKSAHVSGDAVDIGPAEAIAWLSERGAAYGLCQIYSNEPWHYELRPDAVDHGCPPMYADPTQDPRMR